MPSQIAYQYYNAITAIEAQEILVQLRIVDFPTIKKEDRRKFHRDMHKLAYPKAHENKKPVTMEQILQTLRGMGS